MKSNSKSIAIALLLIMGLLMTPIQSALAMPAQAELTQTSTDQVVEAAFDYLASQQNPDGGLKWFDDTSSAAVTLRAVLALAANHYGQDHLLSEDGLSPIDYLAAEGINWVNQEETEEPGLNIARAGQLLTAVAAANEDPQQFGDQGSNLVSLIKENYDANTGIYGASAEDNVTDQIWAILGLVANNFVVPEEASAWLASVQDEEGRWNGGFGSYLDTTPIALLALVASGYDDVDASVIDAGLNFMLDNQGEEGGWLTEWDTLTNASITGAMLQTIAALGDIPMSDNWQLEGGTPYSAVLDLQQESGVIGGDYANTYSTADALLGLSGQPLFKLGDLVQASNAFDYIFASQDSAGGWVSVGQTVDVVLAVQAAGWNPTTLQITGNSPLNYIEAGLGSYIEAGPDAVGKAILGLVALGQDPTDFGDLNLPEILMEEYDETTLAFGDPGNTWHQALALLGLSAAGSDLPDGAVTTLASLQQEDGGWEYSAGFGTGPDNTALAIQALFASGVEASDSVIEDGMAYIEATQTDAGGWGDSSSTSYVLMAFNALGESLDDWTTANATDPVTSLMSFQKANGSFVYNWEFSDDSLMSTASALLALFGGDYLVSPLPETNYAAIIVDPGDGEAKSACVQLDADTISGMDLLDASGFEYDVEEGFINSILGVSNPEGETNYWSYWTWNGQEWAFQPTGANDSVVVPGTVEGWYFTSWEIYPSLPPDTLPVMSTICESGRLLKDYNIEPALSYNDLYHAEAAVIVDEPVVDSTEEIVEGTEGTPATAVPEEAPTQEAQAPDSESSSLPLTPIIILGALAVVIVVVILSINRKNKK